MLPLAARDTTQSRNTLAARGSTGETTATTGWIRTPVTRALRLHALYTVRSKNAINVRSKNAISQRAAERERVKWQYLGAPPAGLLSWCPG